MHTIVLPVCVCIFLFFVTQCSFCQSLSSNRTTMNVNPRMALLICNTESREALYNRFRKTPRDGDNSQCPSLHFIFAALFRADRRTEDKLFVSIGVNKGYDIIQFLGLWSTTESDILSFEKWGMLLSKMHNQGRETNDEICGACKECLERIRILPIHLPQRNPPQTPESDVNLNASPTSRRRKRKRSPLQARPELPLVVAVDSNTQNIASLRRIKQAYPLPFSPVLAVMAGAASADDARILPPCSWGSDSCPSAVLATSSPINTTAINSTVLTPAPFAGFGAILADDSDLPTSVRVYTLPSLLSELQLNGTVPHTTDISILLLRAGGSEPAILMGGEAVIRTRVRLVVFAYDPSTWHVRGEQSLRKYVTTVSEWLTPHGSSHAASIPPTNTSTSYTGSGTAPCYLLGSSRVWKLTHGCWVTGYGKDASTIACVRTGDVWEGVLDGLAVRHRGRG